MHAGRIAHRIRADQVSLTELLKLYDHIYIYKYIIPINYYKQVLFVLYIVLVVPSSTAPGLMSSSSSGTDVDEQPQKRSRRVEGQKKS